MKCSLQRKVNIIVCEKSVMPDLFPITCIFYQIPGLLYYYSVDQKHVLVFNPGDSATLPCKKTGERVGIVYKEVILIIY